MTNNVPDERLRAAKEYVACPHCEAPTEKQCVCGNADSLNRQEDVMHTQKEIEMGLKIIALQELLGLAKGELHHDRDIRSKQEDGSTLLHCDLNKCIKCRISLVMAQESSIKQVLDTAIQFVLHEWSEAADLKGTESMSAPAEFMLLHEAVCKLKGWEPYGEYPDEKVTA